MDKKFLRKFDVKIQSLSNNKHSFLFEFNHSLLEHFSEEIEMKNTLGECNLEIIKTDMMLNATFSIKGSTELICDRTLKNFITTWAGWTREESKTPGKYSQSCLKII